jgi:HEPN domain-containing protein
LESSLTARHGWLVCFVPNHRWKVWLAQAENDLLWGQDSHERGYYAQTCFIAQQVAEKALKCLAYFRGAELVKSHSCRELAQSLAINGELAEELKEIDQYYISSRYPDALPGGAPFETFTARQAQSALDTARAVIDRVKRETNGNS